jgi:hypothetical protein
VPFKTGTSPRGTMRKVPPLNKCFEHPPCDVEEGREPDRGSVSCICFLVFPGVCLVDTPFGWFALPNKHYYTPVKDF